MWLCLQLTRSNYTHYASGMPLCATHRLVKCSPVTQHQQDIPSAPSPRPRCSSDSSSGASSPPSSSPLKQATSSMHKNITFLFPIAHLIENTHRYYEMYSIFLLIQFIQQLRPQVPTEFIPMAGGGSLKIFLQIFKPFKNIFTHHLYKVVE